MANVVLTTTRDGFIEYLKALTNNTDNTNLYARLFKNDAVINEDTVIGDLTESTNYTAVELLGPTWSINYNDVANRGEAIYQVPVEFTFTGSDDIYGVYVTDVTGAVLIAAGKFLAANPVQAEDQIKLTTIQINLDN